MLVIIKRLLTIVSNSMYVIIVRLFTEFQLNLQINKLKFNLIKI
jgi:hypothetical protein